MKKTITVDGVESKKLTIIIKSNTGETYKNGEPKQDKYTIWIKEKDKDVYTKAYNQFQKLRPIAGDKFEVDVWEADDSFVNEKGQTVNYTKRVINEFVMIDENTPSVMKKRCEICGNLY